MSTIPHIIHYCWFGNGEKPAIVQECMASWRTYFPGWEIKEWNESNYDVNVIPYTAKAYSEKRWAFVSDYVRFDVLYKYGGIYLDVDVEFIKPLSENILEKNAFTGFEYTGIVAPGLIFAVSPKFCFLENVLNMFRNSQFSINPNGTFLTVNMQLTNLLKKEGLRVDNTMQTIAGITIYPSEYFCGYNTDIREPEITENTICWHHYLGSWQKKGIKVRIQDSIKCVVGIKNYKKIIKLKRKLIKNMWS